MSKILSQANGDILQESPQKMIKRLAQELSNTQRQLQLSEQIRSQLERINATSTKIKDIITRLNDRTDLADSEVRELQKNENLKKKELKELEQRLSMLRDIESNECRLNVKLMPYKKTKNNALLIDNKEVFVDNSESGLNVDDEDTEEDNSDYGSKGAPIRSRNSSNGTEQTGSADSWHTFDVEDELNDLTPKRTGRIRVIPQRFEFRSFPGLRAKRRSNGLVVGLIIIVVLALIISLLNYYNYIKFEPKSVDSVLEFFNQHKWQSFVDYLPSFE